MMIFCDYDRHGNYRGYLCPRCKLLLVLANDDPVILQRWVDYLSATRRTAAA
jgi:hypothetical protein